MGIVGTAWKSGLDHVPKVVREPIRGFYDLMRQNSPSMLIL
jgi:hypothetical protein